MNDDQSPVSHAAWTDGPGPGPARGDDRGVTGLLRSDATVLMLARRALDAAGGGPAGAVAARRELDSELREMAGWPRGSDYARAADACTAAGRYADAALLRSAVGADDLLARARTGWNTRYDARPSSPVTEMTYAMRGAGIIDFDPAGPYLGTDGAAYEPGACAKAGRTEPVLVITGRGGAEFLAGWPGFDAMAAWVAGRGTTASGPLAPPPATGNCRAWAEDQVLARLVTSPRDVPRLSAGLPADTFTTDIRYDAYQAILTLSRRGSGHYTPGQVTAELTARMAALPPHATASYGASGTLPRAYLARLAATEVTAEAAASTAAALAAEDARYRTRPAPGPRQAQFPAVAPGRQSRQAQAPSAGPHLPPPRPLPGPAPVQGR